MKIISPVPLNPDHELNVHTDQSSLFFNNISQGLHSFRSLGNDYAIDIEVEFVPGSRLVLFNKKLAQELEFPLPESDEELEQIILENFAWFKYDKSVDSEVGSKGGKSLFATRYQDADDKSVGSALGDGRASWVGEVVYEGEAGVYRYIDIVLKGTGVTSLAWFNHPRENHKDGQVGLTEAVHEYIYSSAAEQSGINSVGVLAVIELPFMREVDNEKAAIVVRVGNHLRFAHYLYFSDNKSQLKNIFDYGLKRDLGLALTHTVSGNDVRDYLDLIVTNLADDAAVYFDVHAVHGSPTFGNRTSCGGTIDFATFVFPDAHHENYSYMSDGANRLGGEWGQTEQFFNLFSGLVESLKASRFEYEAEIMPVEYFLRKFNIQFGQVLTTRWLLRLGLSAIEIDKLSEASKEQFYDIIKLLYVTSGTKKIKFKQGKTLLAAFEPRKILSRTADNIDKFDRPKFIWERLFKVSRNWGTYKFVDAKPYLKIYIRVVLRIVNELKGSKQMISAWQQRSLAIQLSERKEPGADFFYDSERLNAYEEVMYQIHSTEFSWSEISNTAENSILKLSDQGLL